MWETLLLDAAGDVGRMRRMLPVCPTGIILNYIRDNEGSYREALQEISEKQLCLQYRSCLECKLGQDSLIDQMRADGYVVVGGEREVFDHYGVSGFGRTFPSRCEAGQSLRLVHEGLLPTQTHEDDRQAILALVDTQGCLQRLSCSQCEFGAAYLIDDLKLLSEEGLSSVKERWEGK